MKKLYSLYLLLLFFVLACQTPPESSEEETQEITLEESFLLIEQDIAYTRGSWIGNEFASEWYGFRYQPAPGIISTSEETLKEINAMLSMNFDGPDAELEDYTKMQIAYEVMDKTGDGSTTLEILSEKIFSEDLSVEQYVEILTMELSITHGRDVVFAENTTRLLGNSYYLELSATINIDGNTIYQTILLSRKGDRIATVQLHYNDIQMLEEILSSFKPY